MALVDLKKFPVQGETFLDGEIASRLLEIAGIVCNKNVIPGDCDAAHASGLRFGLPWLTQRGVTREQLREIARLVKFTLERVRTFTIWSPTGEKKCRGRVPPGVLRTAAEKTLAIADALPYPPQPPLRAEKTPVRSAVGDRTALLLRGDKVRLALDQMLTARLPVDGSPVRAEMLDSDGREMADVIAQELESADGQERWLLLPAKDRAGAVRRWIEDLSDGYLMFDESDLQQKIDGPIAVEEFDVSQLPHEFLLRLQTHSDGSAADATKPWFIGQRKLYAALKPPPKGKYQYVPAEPPLRKTVLNAIHHQLSAKMAAFAGWEMPIQYPAGILAEHRAVRTAAGLFDVSHMSAFEVGGPHALGFLELLLANRASRLAPGEAQYSSALYPDGTHIDDLYVYRLDRERFMLVVNAANAERVMDWVAAVNSRRFAIDEEMPAKEIDAPGPAARPAARRRREPGRPGVPGAGIARSASEAGRQAVRARPAGAAGPERGPRPCGWPGSRRWSRGPDTPARRWGSRSTSIRWMRRNSGTRRWRRGGRWAFCPPDWARGTRRASRRAFRSSGMISKANSGFP